MREFFRDFFSIFVNLAKAFNLIALELPQLVVVIIKGFKSMFEEDTVAKPVTRRK